jgi:hypothetical protein
MRTLVLALSLSLACLAGCDHVPHPHAPTGDAAPSSSAPAEAPTSPTAPTAPTKATAPTEATAPTAPTEGEAPAEDPKRKSSSLSVETPAEPIAFHSESLFAAPADPDPAPRVTVRIGNDGLFIPGLIRIDDDGVEVFGVLKIDDDGIVIYRGSARKDPQPEPRTTRSF